MQIAELAIVFLAVITGGYWLYGRFVARVLRIDDRTKTPAHAQRDGVDFVPTKKFYLFGQHFSAIAAAGPIAGPILAVQLFGWGPSLLWIGVGVVLIGAVHDFTSLIASVRHKACSMAEVAREYLGQPAGRAMMAFIWMALLYIIIAFTDITAGSFVRGTDEVSGSDFHPGGAVAAASIFYLVLSMIMGCVERFLRPPLWLLTVVFVPAAFGVCWLGTQVSSWFLLDVKTWALVILAYCAVASVLPVWALLQPRGYLGGFILYTALLLGVIGIFFGHFEIKQEFFKDIEVAGGAGAIFPFLFVTIACGACSGFHGLVCGGTTSKQLDRESDARAIGFGAMLAEGFVAFIAVVAIMIASSAEVEGLKPGAIYGNAIGNFMTLVIGKEHLVFAMTFGAMAFSTFVFDTLDVAARLGRYILQEFFGWKERRGVIFGALLTLLLPTVVLMLADEGSWIQFWTLFGASNQLMAALTLLSVTLWLVRSKRNFWVTAIPMVFVFVMTVWALIEIITRSNFSAATGVINAFVALTFVVLALFLVWQGIREFRRCRR